MVSTLNRRPQQARLPEAGVWDLDPAHSSISFVVRHMMVAKVRGRFGAFSGAISIADAAERSSVEVTIDPATIDTGIGQRDDHLRSADFFDVAGFPAVTFRSTRLEPGAAGAFRLHGDLTIRGTTRPVVLDAEFHGEIADFAGGSRLGFSATTEINREDFGMTWNQVIEAGGFAVSKKVKIEIEAAAVRNTSAQA